MLYAVVRGSEIRTQGIDSVSWVISKVVTGIRYKHLPNYCSEGDLIGKTRNWRGLCTKTNKEHTSYLSIVVYHRIFRAKNSTPNKCVNLQSHFLRESAPAWKKWWQIWALTRNLPVDKLAAMWLKISDLKEISRFIFRTISFFGQFDQTERLQWR